MSNIKDFPDKHPDPPPGPRELQDQVNQLLFGLEDLTSESTELSKSVNKLIRWAKSVQSRLEILEEKINEQANIQNRAGPPPDGR